MTGSEHTKCSHPGASGPCHPRVSDGRCVWCEREMYPGSAVRPPAAPSTDLEHSQARKPPAPMLHGRAVPLCQRSSEHGMHYCAELCPADPTQPCRPPEGAVWRPRQNPARRGSEIANYRLMRAALPPGQLPSERAERYLRWLAGFDWETAEAVADLFRFAQGSAGEATAFLFDETRRGTTVRFEPENGNHFLPGGHTTARKYRVTVESLTAARYGKGIAESPEAALLAARKQFRK